MPRKKKPAEATEPSDAISDELLADITEEHEEEQAKGVADEIGAIEEIPAMESLEWHDYVMKQFAEDEVNEKGHPFIYGLRRVVRQVLGPIVMSHGEIVQCSDGDPKTPVVSQHLVRVYIKNLPNEEPYTAEVTEVSDVTMANTDFQFWNHASATASTKAEGRALRKILGLRRVISAEEGGGLQFDEPSPDGKITGSLATALRMYCHLNGISMDKVLTQGKNKYTTVEDIPQATAEKMFETIQEWVRTGTTPPNFRE